MNLLPHHGWSRRPRVISSGLDRAESAGKSLKVRKSSRKNAVKGDAGERIFLLVQTGPEMNYARVVPVAVLVDAALIIGQFY